MDQVLSWLLIPYEALQYLWTTVVFGIGTALSWLHETLQFLWTAVVFGTGTVLSWLYDAIAAALSWLRIPYDALAALPYFWLRAALGIAAGLFIRRAIVGLSVCVLGNAALYYCAGWNHDPSLNLMVLLTWSIFAWWLVGRILRWGTLTFGFQFAAGVAALSLGLWLLTIALPHIALGWFVVWFVVRVAWIGLMVTAAALVILGLHFLLDDRLARLLDDWRFRRSLR
jgi:hypothetical protein